MLAHAKLTTLAKAGALQASLARQMPILSLDRLEALEKGGAYSYGSA